MRVSVITLNGFKTTKDPSNDIITTKCKSIRLICCSEAKLMYQSFHLDFYKICFLPCSLSEKTFNHIFSAPEKTLSFTLSSYINQTLDYKDFETDCLLRIALSESQVQME